MVNYPMLLRDYGLPMHDNNCWWVRNSERAFHEIERMLQNTNCIFYCEGDKFICEEAIANNFGTEFVIKIVVDSGFPFNMPKAYITYSDIDLSNAEHRYSEGHLCLMHPSEYNSNTSILQIRNLAAAWTLCAEVQLNTGEWPAAEYQH